jgi:hypothetical protein
MSRETALKAKVNAVNRAHAYAHRLYATLAPIFQPLIGEKIFKADGTLTAKCLKLMPELPHGIDLHVYKHVSDYSLAWTVKTCEMIEGESCCLYYEITVYVGEMNKGVLTKLSTPFSGRVDYTPAEIQDKRNKVELAEKALSDARSALWPFAERDS